MFSLLCVFWVVVVTQAREYTRITNYDDYVSQWHQKVPKEHIHDVTHLATKNELCYGKKCKYYFYQYFSEGRVEKDRNRTVLLVSGMHGNQYLGPHVLLHGYEHFEAAHIVYFPLANPSGFTVNKRQTQPTQLDINRDFPVDHNQECYQTNAALILDHLFRKYKFDLTIVLHDGSTEIGFNWGTFTHLENSHTEDYQIQEAIGQLLLKSAGKSDTLTPFKMGTMDEVVYAAKGSFDDWAYSIGRYPDVITKSCLGHQFEPYPSGSASDLVFLLELGPHQSTAFGSEAALLNNNGVEYAPDGYVSRGIRMVRDSLKVVSPALHFQWRESIVDITVEGCPQALLTTIDISEIKSAQLDQKPSKYLLTFDDPIEVGGNCRPEPPKPTSIPLQKAPNFTDNSLINYRGSFECGMQWMGIGSTSFSKIRKYRFDVWQSHSDLKAKDQFEDEGNFISKWMAERTMQDYLWMAIVVICVLVLMSAIFAVLQCLLKPRVESHPAKLEHGTVEEMDGGEDLHTARGGIIQENM